MLQASGRCGRIPDVVCGHARTHQGENGHHGKSCSDASEGYGPGFPAQPPSSSPRVAKERRRGVNHRIPR
eukprot:1466606-Rhodomonas_salina.1